MTTSRQVPRLRRSLTFVMSDGWRGEVVELSAVGMRLHSLAALDPDTVIEGALHLGEGRLIRLRGVVRWSTPANPSKSSLAKHGVQLADVPEEYLKELARLFAEDES